MPTVVFTPNVQRHVASATVTVAGGTVREALEHVFASNPRVRSYVLDDQAALRRHMSIYVDGALIRDRQTLSDDVSDTSVIYVFQALSGG